MKTSISKQNTTSTFLVRFMFSAGATLLILSMLGCGPGGNSNAPTTNSTTSSTPATSASPTVNLDQAKKDVEATLQNIVNGVQGAVAKRDNAEAALQEAQGIEKFFTADVIVIDGSGRTSGLSKYRTTGLQSTLKSAIRNYQISGFKTTVDRGGETAWSSFQYSLEADVNGKPTPVLGYGSAVLRREGGAWKVALVQTSGRPAREGERSLPEQ